MTPSEAHEWLWQQGWRIFVDDYGWKEDKARTLVGSWISRQGPVLAHRAVCGISDKHPIEPISWAAAGFRAIHAKNAKLNKIEHVAPAKLPPQVPLDERVKPERLAELRRELEEM